MVVRKAQLVCVIAAVAFGVGCGKKSAEDTERDWHSTEENAQKYSAKYPAAKPVIDDLDKQAKADFEEAKKGDEKTRADKMQVAVDRLGRPLQVFATYETEVGKLDALLQDKTLMSSLSAADFKPLDQAASAAKKRACCIIMPTVKACTDLEGTCVAGPAPANMGDLKGQLEGAIKQIQDATKALDAKKPKPVAPATPPPAAKGSAAAPAAGSAAAPAAPAAPAAAGSGSAAK